MDEKLSASNELKEKLFMKKSHGGETLNDDQIKETYDFANRYKDFLGICKTEREAVQYTANRAQKSGFKEFDKKNTYKPGDKVYFIHKNKTLILAVIGKDNFENGVNFAIAHIDCPRLDLKPTPLYENNDLAYFKTHYYGGIKKYQWPTVPLSLHGRIVRADESYVDIRLGDDENEPCFCITDLLPHLAKDQMAKTMLKAVTGENLNVLIGSLPFKDDKGSELVKLNILKLLNEKYNITESDFISAELELVPAYKPRDLGFDRSMIGGYGHDDRCCAYASIESILEVESPNITSVVVLADKEEVGSDGTTGMKSSFVKYFIADLIKNQGLKTRDVFTRSKCLSIDVDAGFDPNFASEYDTTNSCYLNKGVVMTKYTGSGGKMGTSDACAEFAGKIRAILSSANVLWQTGELGKVDGGGGGTIAKFISNLNIDVIDIGVPVLSMHSPFEVISKIDLFMCYKAIKAFFEN
ncbi:MAG: aminopeptidase [Oscillospiraceae bacterium]|nr:aminopeptidase [Oscillospiraceae bacterium]